MNSNQLASYKNASYTLQKTRQIVLLYDAAIRFTSQAQQAIQEEDFAKRFELLQKVSNILAGLHSALDYENGGEISKVLSSFYTGLDLRVIAINRTNNVDECEYVVSELKNMRNSWEKIDHEYGVAGNNAAEQINASARSPLDQRELVGAEGADFSA